MSVTSCQRYEGTNSGGAKSLGEKLRAIYIPLSMEVDLQEKSDRPSAVSHEEEENSSDEIQLAESEITEE